MLEKLIRNPMTLKRLRRFKAVRRAYAAFWIILVLYALGLCAELICNDVPLYVRYNGQHYFPVFRFYPEDEFTGNGRKTRPDYKAVNQTDAFQRNPDNVMAFPVIPYGPFESVDTASIPAPDHVVLTAAPLPKIAVTDILPDFTIFRDRFLDDFIPGREGSLQGKNLKTFFTIPETVARAVEKRFANETAASVTEIIRGDGGAEAALSLSDFSPRPRPPRTVRLTFRSADPAETTPADIVFDASLKISGAAPEFWETLPAADRRALREKVEQRRKGHVAPMRLHHLNRTYNITFAHEEVRFPYKPVRGHWMGVDGAGRDVLARILYGLRTSLTFGLLLAVCSMALGMAAGAIQGYYAGLLDITAQRLIEIWSALPFLYVMILMGAIYGRSFALLLFCYGLFNWIGISYYVRAEFLRLRKSEFVEAARCMGLSSAKIIFKHILPNALIPVITFFPFSLVGAIGALAALDYLGFGLPPPTPSWGELLFQAQQYRWAWWLILYPSLALFLVMLAGVFIGEGVRNAYDPKQYTRLE